MNTIPGTGSSVLVTGGTGFLAAWIIVQLLESGYDVRTTVRDESRAERVRCAVAEKVGDPIASRLEFAVADLRDDAGWDDAVAGVDYVLHTASPLSVAKDQDIVALATDGVRRVLGAADRAGVKRVVLTSSGFAAVPDDLADAATEATWATPSGKPAEAYSDSKIAAERVAWALSESASFELVTVLPSFMQGPTLGTPAKGGSPQVIGALLSGGMPAIPRLGWDIVDVRDIAALHLRAMTLPAAAGQRLLGGTGTFLWWKDMAAILRAELSDRASKVPTRAMPSVLVAVLSLVNRQMAQLRPQLGRQVRVDSHRTRELTGWDPQFSATQTVVDTATSLIDKSALTAA